MENRRKFVRLNMLADVFYKKRSLLRMKKLSTSKNISKGGICLIAYEDLRKGDLLDLKIYLSDDKKAITGIGKVAWTKEFVIGDVFKGKRYDVGVEFIKINDTDLSKIDRYVFSHVKVDEANPVKS
jgi:c-di-GMP-binding flagellar brake protein YcgR